MPTWPSADLSEIDFDNIFYYLRPTDNSAEKNWDDVDADLVAFTVSGEVDGTISPRF